MSEKKIQFDTKNDINVAVIKDGKDLLINEDCCTCINILLKNDGQILTSFMGSHNPYIVSQLEKAQKAYFKALKKALKNEFKHDGCSCGEEHCDCGDDCHGGDNCECGDNCDCDHEHHCGDEKCKVTKDCKCTPENHCGCYDGKPCTCGKEQPKTETKPAPKKSTKKTTKNN